MAPLPNPKSKNAQESQRKAMLRQKEQEKLSKLKKVSDEEKLRQINKQIATCWKYKEIALQNGDFINYHYFDEKLKEAFNKKRRC